MPGPTDVVPAASLPLQAAVLNRLIVLVYVDERGTLHHCVGATGADQSSCFAWKIKEILSKSCRLRWAGVCTPVADVAEDSFHQPQHPKQR